MKTNTLTSKTIIAYSSGNLGYGFVTHGITSYLMFYATAVLLLPGTWVGIIISLGIVWDAVSDPIMGFISDETHSKIGKRHIYILLGSLLIVIANLLLWNINPKLSLGNKFVELMIYVFLMKTFLTIFITPYSALGTELSSDYYERSKIQVIKTMFFLAALVMVTAFSMLVFFKPTKAYPIGQLNPIAYRYMAYTGSFIMLVTGLLTFFKTQAYRLTSTSRRLDLKTFYHNILFSLKLKNFRAMVIGYLSTNIASAIIAVFGLHVFTYTFHLNNKWISLIIGSQFVIATITQPMWLKIAVKTEKKIAISIGLFISMIGCLVLAGLVILRTFVIMYPIILISYAVIVGFGSSPLFSIPPSMIGDIVDQQEYETSYRNEGIFFGMMNFGYKISQSIAIFILGIVLDLVGFKAESVVQSQFTSVSIGLVLGLGSLLSFLGAYIAYSHYNLNQEVVLKMQEELNNKVKEDIL
ncbi:MAG: MFS transporter [Clostridia bacterium]|nr:MFS transporter [Clostridia bacterium]